MNRRKSRESAFLVIFENFFNNISNEEIIKTAQIERNLEVDDFALSLINGVETNKAKLEELISNNTKGWKKERISKVSLATLLIAIYEILFDKSIPNSVSINEAIELTKKYSVKDDASFVNGILSTIVKKEN